MIDDNTRRIQIPDGEVRELTSPDGLLWERAVSKIKGRLEAAYVTRDNGILHLKAFGATPIKHKAEKLWGRYVPAKATDETLYPMVLTGYGTLVANGTEDYTSPTISEGKLYRNTATAGIADNSKFSYCSRTYLPATQTTRTNHSQYFTSASGYCDFIDNDYSSVASFKAALAANPVTILYALATSDGSVWKFVKDIGLDGTGSDFGYYNEATGEFVKAQGASGTVIQPISYAESDGTAWVDTMHKIGTKDIITITLEWAQIEQIGWFGARRDPARVDGTYHTSVANGMGIYMGNGFPYFVASPNTKYTIKTHGLNTLPTVNGTPMTYTGTLPFTDVTPSLNAYVFAINYSTPVQAMKGKVYNIEVEGKFHYIPVRVGTSQVELLDLVSWQFAQRTGTFTAGADIQLVADVITVNTGDLMYGQYGNKYGIFTDGTHKVKLSKDGTQIAERNIPLLLSEDSFVDIQTGNKSEAWAVKVLDGTEAWSLYTSTGHPCPYMTISDMVETTSASDFVLCSHSEYNGAVWANDNIGFGLSTLKRFFIRHEVGESLEEFKAWLASEYAKGTPVIILYPLATPITDQVTIAPIASARRTTYVADSESELGKLNLELKFLGK